MSVVRGCLSTRRPASWSLPAHPSALSEPRRTARQESVGPYYHPVSFWSRLAEETPNEGHEGGEEGMTENLALRALVTVRSRRMKATSKLNPGFSRVDASMPSVRRVLTAARLGGCGVDS